jgi:hypothetical protein|tara:strand:- start:592 stop:852 length:261 start_codon:yes stop_codon:yes gene_type:complete
MEITYMMDKLYMLLIFFAVVISSIITTQTREEFISLGYFGMGKKKKKKRNKNIGIRARINKELRKTTKRMIPVLKRQIDKLNLISL